MNNASARNPFVRATQVVGQSLALVGHVLGNVERLVSDVTRDSAQVATSATALYADAAVRATAALATMRTAPRVARLVTEVLRLVALYKLRGPSDELHAEGAARLHDLCVELRGG